MILETPVVKKKRILAVDDIPAVLRTIRHMLQEEYQVIPHTSGKAAIDYLERGDAKIDLVLLDVDMPDATGLDVLKTMKSHPKLSHIPVVMVTGNAEADTVFEAIQGGAVGYIVKPFAEETLIEKIRSALSK